MPQPQVSPSVSPTAGLNRDSKGRTLPSRTAAAAPRSGSLPPPPFSRADHQQRGWQASAGQLSAHATALRPRADSRGQGWTGGCR